VPYCCLNHRMGPMKNTPERPSPRVFTSNCGKHDARYQDNALAEWGFRTHWTAKLHSSVRVTRIRGYQHHATACSRHSGEGSNQRQECMDCVVRFAPRDDAETMTGGTERSR
jgi:hypothetical protein